MSYHLPQNEIEYDLIIKHFIKKFGKRFYSLDDIYGVAAIGLVKAIKCYNSDKGCKFQTFAFSCMSKQCLRELRDLKRIKRGSQIEIISIDAPLTETDNLFLSDLIADNSFKENESDMNYDIAIKLIKKHVTKIEYKILILTMKGYKDKEISEILNISQKLILDIRKNIKFRSDIIDICFRLEIKRMEN